MKNPKRVKEMNEILNNTLNQMENVFTSNLFAKVAEINGITRKEIEYDCIPPFLKQKCKRYGSNRRWIKKQSNNIERYPTTKNQIKSDEDIINEAIEILKLNGYRILKPVSDWVEL